MSIDEEFPNNWGNKIFGKNPDWYKYGHFIANLFNLEFRKIPVTIMDVGRVHEIVFKRVSNAEHRYSIITLNYDTIPEKICEFLNSTFKESSSIEFSNEKSAYDNSWSLPSLVKLHGCMREGNIIPPTWSKGERNEISQVWNRAYQVLVDANYVRIIGYSLPTTDNYVKFLLKASVLEAPNLKGIDVICLDQGGETRERYEEFIHFMNYNFVNANSKDYLNALLEAQRSPKGQDVVKCDKLEIIHEEFVRNH